METVTHREMRNRSGEILRRVEAGESVLVSNNGHLAALIVPVGGDPALRIGADEIVTYDDELARAAATAGIRVVAPA